MSSLMDLMSLLLVDEYHMMMDKCISTSVQSSAQAYIALCLSLEIYVIRLIVRLGYATSPQSIIVIGWLGQTACWPYCMS